MKLIERRGGPRFSVCLNSVLSNQQGVSVPAVVSNISESGLQFSLQQENIQSLLPHAGNHNAMDPAHLRVAITLNDTATVEVKCGVVYLRKSSQTACLLGCRFEHFYAQSHELLLDYLNRSTQN